MKRLLCLVGLHDWEHFQALRAGRAGLDPRNFERVASKCRRCGHFRRLV